MKYKNCYEEVYAHYYAEAVDNFVEWTGEHDKFVEDVASDLYRYMGDTMHNFFNVEAPELPGMFKEKSNA
jgi:hypothetical protein